MQADQMYRACTDALRDFMEGIGATDAVIGLSGGLDSSVVAAMAVDALGADHVHGIMMPGPYSTDHSLTDAADLAEALGIAADTVSIREPFEAFTRVLEGPMDGFGGLAAENTQARCRMTVLMAFSNARGWTVLNTGNKSEACMGYSTLYGDTAGAFAPIGGLYKTDVYAVARWRNEEAVRNGQALPVPQHVLDKPPSAELAPDQSDEKSMGVDYPMLDRILIGVLEQGRTVEDLAAEGVPADVADYVLKRTASYAYKRALEPPYPDVVFYE